MSHWSPEALEPCIGQRLLSGEATCGIGIENDTDEVLGCDVGRESRTTAFPQAAIGPRCPQISILSPLMRWKTRIYVRARLELLVELTYKGTCQRQNDSGNWDARGY